MQTALGSEVISMQDGISSRSNKYDVIMRRVSFGNRSNDVITRGPPKVVGHHRHKHGLKNVYYKIVYKNC